MKSPWLFILCVGTVLGSLQTACISWAVDKSEESIDVRYARASLALAQMQLEKAVASNNPIAGIMPEAAIEPLRQLAAISEEQLREARDGAAPNARNIEIRAAKASLAAAQADLQKAVATNQAVPGLVGAGDLRRLELAVDVAKLRVEKAQSLPVQFTAAELQWQLRELTKAVLELRSRVEQLSARE